MAFSTVADYINKSLQKIGVLADGETATTTQLADALDTLNAMLVSWAGSNLLTTAQIQENFDLVSGTATYSIGANQTFNTTKPFGVASAFIRDTANTDHNVDVVARLTYDRKSYKDDTGIPGILFYDTGAVQQANQSGTIKLYPTPNANYTLYIKSEKPFTEFAATTDTITFPAIYNRAIVFNLAIELAADYGITVPAEVVVIAKTSKEIIENINSQNKMMTASLSIPGEIGTYNAEFE